MNMASRWFIMPGILGALLLAGMIALFLLAEQNDPVAGQEGGGTPSNPPAATPTPEPATSPTPDSTSNESRIEGTMSWGTVVMTNLPGIIPEAGGASGASGSSGTGDTSQQTPLTVADITPPQGGVNLEFTYDRDTVQAIRVERRTRIDDDPPYHSTWVLLAESHTRINRYPDYTAPHDRWHDYRITPILGNGDELDQDMTPAFRPTNSALISGHGVEENDEVGVTLAVKPYPFLPSVNMKADIKRYDHRERHPTLAQWTQTISFDTPPGPIVDTSDLTEGEIYYYTVEYFIQAPDATERQAVNLPPVPAGIMAGVVAPTTPSAPTVTIESKTTGKTTVSWTLDSNNKQAIAHLLERRALRPIERFSPMGLVRGTSLTFLADTTSIDMPYEYRVRPFGLEWQPYDPGPTTVTPTPAELNCAMANDPDWPGGIHFMGVALDMTGAAIGYSERSIDLLTRGRTGFLCLAPDPDAFYLMRQLVSVHTKEESCPGQSSCDLPQFAEDDYRIMYGSRGYVWGFPRMTFIGFDDEPLPQGKYDIRYKICISGKDQCSRGFLVSNVLVGVESVPFTHDAQIISVNREFPSIYTRP